MPVTRRLNTLWLRDDWTQTTEKHLWRQHEHGRHAVIQQLHKLKPLHESHFIRAYLRVHGSASNRALFGGVVNQSLNLMHLVHLCTCRYGHVIILPEVWLIWIYANLLCWGWHTTNCVVWQEHNESNFVFSRTHPEIFEVGHVGLPFTVLLHVVTSALCPASACKEWIKRKAATAAAQV